MPLTYAGNELQRMPGVFYKNAILNISQSGTHALSSSYHN